MALTGSGISLFQFQIGAIKSHSRMHPHQDIRQCFNSKLVRLKVSIDSNYAERY